MAKGKDHPNEMPADPTNEKGETIGFAVLQVWLVDNKIIWLK